MTRFGFRLAAAVTVALALGAAARAEDSNRNDVRANLSKDGWTVVWGKNFTEADWVRGLAAIAESVASENPGPFLKWFEATLDENFVKIERNMKDVGRADLKKWVAQSLKAKRPVTYKGLQIEAGFATYDRWQSIIYDEPRTRKVNHFPFFEAFTERVERKTNLPNWHQFYVRYKLVPSGPGDSGPGKPPANDTVVKVKYTIKNESDKTVRFSMKPSGKSYTLAAGKLFTGTSNEVNGKAPSMTLADSNKTYKLTAGNHRFWWMAKEKRVGFDRSTD